MSAVDWAEFFESVSHVDAVLRADSDFAAMEYFPDPRSLSARDRRTRTRLRAHRDRSRPTRNRSRQARSPRGSEPRRRNCSPRAGSRLLPHLERASCGRERARIPRSLSRLDCSRQRGRRNPRLSRNDRCRQRDHPRSAVARPCGVWRQRMDSLHSRDSRRDPRNGRGHVASEPRLHDLYRSGNPAWSGVSRRGTGRTAHDCRGPHSPDDASGTRGASRASGGSSSGESGRRPSLRLCSRTGPIPQLKVRQATTSFSAQPPTQSRA